MKIAGRGIGTFYRPYVIAEMSASHNGSLKRGIRIIEEAKKAGADSIKIQCYTADNISIATKSDDTLIKDGPWKGYYLHDLYKEAETPPELVRDLFYAGEALGITVFASVFDFSGVDLMVELGAPCLKIASFELTDLPLIKHAAMTGLPMIMSTGMGSDKEINDAVATFRRFSVNPEDLVVLHCVSAYPTSPAEANLPKMGPLSSLFGGLKVGLSDHTLGIGVPAAAAAYGACVIEKHLTLRRSDGGPDAGFSLEPEEFEAMVGAIKDAWAATRPSLSPSQTPNSFYRKSLYAACEVKKGSLWTKENVRVLRPALGLAASAYWDVLGARATEDVPAGTPLKAHHYESVD